MSSLTKPQKAAVLTIFNKLLTAVDEEGRSISEVFNELPPRKELPDYYEIIKRPMALELVKENIKKNKYNAIADFVRDCAQIFYNAKLYNRRSSIIYSDALANEELILSSLKQLRAKGIVEVDSLPVLGPLPPPSEGGESDSDEDVIGSDIEAESEPDEEFGSSGATVARRGKRTKILSSRKDGDEVIAEVRRRRGRPPKVETPDEGRMKAILKVIRKANDGGRLLHPPFEKLPDAKQYPDYYQTIRVPLALDSVKKKIKRKEYSDVQFFLSDMNLIFKNAQAYNEPESAIYQDAVRLQRTLADASRIELNRADSEYVNIDNSEKASNTPARVVKLARTPVERIAHKGDLYEVGDWVHINNANDETKPIIAQIFRTWQNSDGEKWINVCWYYRAEQTVHRADKIWLEHEVVKTGQYRDHNIEEVIEKCFVMFITRYARGRPKDAGSKKIYVCESRYNEEIKTFNRIKSWKSCVPDETRNKDYEMYFFDKVQNVKRVLSPLLHLLPKDATEDPEAPLPDPVQGEPNAPPKSGAIIAAPIPDEAMLNANNTDSPSSPPPAPISRTNSQPHTPIPLQTPRSALPQSLLQIQRPVELTPQVLPQPVYPPQHQMPRLISAGNRIHPTALTFPPGQMNIPQQTKELFLTDADGEVIWFTVPPIDVVKPAKEGAVLGHSARYLARKIEIEKKRKVEWMALHDAMLE